MKKLIFFFLLLPLFTKAQINIYNTSLLDSTKTQLYKYASNYLKVKSSDKYTILLAAKSKVSYLGNNKFDVMPSEDGVDTIWVYSKGKLALTRVFSIDTVSEPIARVANTMDTILSVRQILTNPFLGVMLPGSNFKSNFVISSFTTIVTTQNDEEIIDKSLSNNLTPDQIKTIKNLGRGDRILFQDIIGGGPDSRRHKLPNFRIHIK